MEYNSLHRITVILNEFKKISGLECNKDKTVLMQVGTRIPINQEILSLGFDIQHSTTLLGLIIENDSFSFGRSIEKITNKIRNEIKFWTKFNLSLPGRINIAKTMLYSQINYLGCILPLNKENIDSFRNLIHNFV